MSNSWWYKNKTSDQKVRSTLTQASHQIELYARLQASLNQSPLLFYVDRLLTKAAQEVQLNPKAKLYFYGDLLTTQNIALLVYSLLGTWCDGGSDGEAHSAWSWCTQGQGARV